MITREDIETYAKENYNTKPEHLWADNPGSEVFRHARNRKWYAIIMDVPKNKVGLDGNEIIDIINVKCEPDMVASLSGQEGFCRAYHMNKEHWLTIILNGVVADEEIFSLIDLSYRLTK